MRLFAWLFMFVNTVSLAQDDLLKELTQSEADKSGFTTSAFNGSRLINGQTIETRNAGELEFIFAHRFGRINDGIYELFGLDQAYVRIGLEYGITDRLGFGIGRNSFDKTVDTYLRYKVLRQSNSMPITLTAYGNTGVKFSPKKEDATFDITFQDRVSYVGQVLIARKFSPSLSLQLMPTFVHKNTVDQVIERNDQVALGFGGRVKVSRMVSITSEYYYRFNVPDNNPYYNSFGVGVDIETGGHVFQLVLTNTRGLTERAFVTETTGDFFEGDLHLGFNITRTFQLKKTSDSR
jgi:hypothetical protein